MMFYSHSKQDVSGETFGSKVLITHIEGVLNKASSHLSKNLAFDYSNQELESLISILAKLHDLGKYTTFFQNYLLKKGNVDNDKKRHPPIGALTAYNLLIKDNEKQALICLYLIFLHHANLTDILQFSEKLSGHLQRILDYQYDDILKNKTVIEHDLKIKDLELYLNYPEDRQIRRGFKLWAKRNHNIQDYYFINYIFSLLIEADKLDASDTPLYSLKEVRADYVDVRFGNPQQQNVDLDSLDNVALRNFCRAEVVDNLNLTDILNHYIFTLTAPTGIGKTMTALDFALKLRAKIRNEQKIEARIIYALPFINIIEQALKEYETTLPSKLKILAHYQYADVFGVDKISEANGEDGSIVNYNQKLMSLDTWQADIVITSFVQFFETLIGNRNKLLKKFNHFANSIIILDEVQTLRLDQMPLIGASLYYLSKFLKARIILMTATKPKIFDLAQSEILNKEGEIVKPKELLNSYEKVFKTFHRTKIVSLLGKKLDDADDFVDSIFKENWSSNKSCIIVCNTVNRSIEVFNAIRNYMEKTGLTNPLEYLSTNIIPAHRFERIKEIRHQLEKGEKPILISTQVVEAGVDLDFDIGFRDLGPIDSIIQVAGRINRNNNKNKKHSPLYIVNFGDGQKIYGSLTAIQAEKALSKKSEIFEGEYLGLIESYFNGISDKSSFDRYNKVFNSMKTLCYDSDNPEDHPVSSFKIIEESRTTKTVFVEFGLKEIELRACYLAKIRNEITKEEFDEKFKQAFQQSIISVPSYYADSLQQINEYEESILYVPFETLQMYYDPKTGFIRKTQSTITHFL